MNATERKALQALADGWREKDGDYPESKLDCADEMLAMLAIFDAKPATRYDWTNPRIQAWVNWLATDDDGAVYGYSEKPEIAGGYWYSASGDGEILFNVKEFQDWEDSLEARPT